MQNYNNNQRPQIPSVPGSTPQFRPPVGIQNQATTQNHPSNPSTSPFANPPATDNKFSPSQQSHVVNNAIRPNQSITGMRPHMSNPHVNFAVNSNIRPPIQFPVNNQGLNMPRPPSPSGMRPSMPQSSQVFNGQAHNQTSSQSIRPPLNSGNQMRPPQGTGLNTNMRPIMQQRPPMRPPVPNSVRPQMNLSNQEHPTPLKSTADLSQTIHQVPQHFTPRPPMSQNQQLSGQFDRSLQPIQNLTSTPRTNFPQNIGPPMAQINRPPMPASTQAVRPPVPFPQIIRPQAPNMQASIRPQAPNRSDIQSLGSHIRPPNLSIENSQMQQQKPSITGNNQPINQIPSYQQNSSINPQMIPKMHQASGIRSPSMRSSVGPVYTQQQQQQHPQTLASNQQQQIQPSYPQTNHVQNNPHYPNQGYANGNVAQLPAAPKVNPAAIPSVVAVLEADELRFKETGQPFYTFSSIIDNPPPLPTTRSVAIIEDGNSSPLFIRSTLNHIPASEEIRENSKIPLSLLIQPFAKNSQNEVPLVDFGPSGPIRCNRCRAYINAHVQFIKGGRYFVCNLCEMSNEVSEEYYANLDMSGKRIDLDLRPELKYGTIDFVASKEYLNRPAGKPHLLFVIDSSRAAVASGAFQASLESIKAFAANSQSVQFYGGIAILVHDRTLTFYTLREGRNEPQILVMGDVFDPFVPLHAKDLFFDPVKCDLALNVLLSHLSTSITVETRPVDSCLGAAVSVAFESLKVRGGRAIFFQTTLPSYGPGALKNRESGSSAGVNASADKANPLLFPQGDYYSKLAVQAAEQRISMSLVVTPAAHIDLATIGILATITSGTILNYSRFTAQQHMSRLIGDVVVMLSYSFAFDCLARIRCNSGLQVKKHYGNFYAGANGHDLSFGTISCDQSFAALLEYDGKLSDKVRVSFQIAFLHTDAFSGQRRIRVLNLALPCTSSIQTVFRMSELDSILAFYLKKNVSQILEAPAAAFPASFSAKCVAILAAYRKYCASTMSSGQLILPDSLKLFPVMILAIHKDPAFNSSPLSADFRWYVIHRLSDLALDLTIIHFYPQLFPISKILEHGEILPACLRLSREHLSREEIYLMNDGNNLTIYVGDSINSELLKELFGVPQLNAVNLGSNVNLPILQNPRSAKLRQIITVLRSQHASRYLNLRLIRQSVDISEEAEFSIQLVEDASPLASSYVDFLCRVHSQIQNTINQGSTLSLAERTSILSFLQ